MAIFESSAPVTLQSAIDPQYTLRCDGSSSAIVSIADLGRAGDRTARKCRPQQVERVCAWRELADHADAQKTFRGSARHGGIREIEEGGERGGIARASRQ